MATRCARRTRTALVLACLTSLLVGCNEPPPKSTFSESELRGNQEVASRAVAESWAIDNLPDMKVHDYKRVAIVHFEVEFVTSTWEAPPRKPGDGEEDKDERAARANNFELKKLKYPAGFQQQLANELYGMVVEELEKRSRVVLPVSAVRSSQAYRQLKTIDTFRTVLLTQNHDDPDRVFPETLMVFPGGGLSIVTGSVDLPIKEVAISLLKEVNADVAAAVRLRVGVFRGRATIEEKSKIWLLSRDVFGSATLARTVTSNSEVLTKDEFQVVRRDAYTVDADGYRAAMRSLFPAVIASGFDASRGTPK